MENRADSALISKLAFEADVVISVPLDGGGWGGVLPVLQRFLEVECGVNVFREGD